MHDDHKNEGGIEIHRFFLNATGCSGAKLCVRVVINKDVDMYRALVDPNTIVGLVG